MPETFPDGFPMTPAEAIEFSYFFTQEEKQEWREWLKSVTDEEKTEMVNTLHTIWMDKQKQVVPDQFSGNASNFAQTNQNQASVQPNFTPQPDFYNSNQPQTLGQNAPMGSPVASPFDFQASNQPEFNFDQAEKPLSYPENPNQEQFNQAQSPNPVNITPAPAIPDFSFENDTNKTFSNGDGQPSKNLNQTNSGNPILNDPKPNPADFGLVDDDKDDFNFDFDDDFDLDDDKEEPAKIEEAIVDPEPKLEPEEVENDDFNFDNSEIKESQIDQAQEVEPQITQAEPEAQTPNKPSVNFSISKVREEATEKELNQLYQNYLHSRTSVSSTKQDHDQSYDELMDKVISIVLNFESVADYLEFMTTKLAQMNETIMKQAEEITTFKNGQNNYAHDLREEVTQLVSRVEVLENKVDADLGDYRNRLDKFEVKFSGQSDSAYTGYDSLNTQIDLLKSKIIKMEKAEPEVTKMPDISHIQVKSSLATLISQPHLPVDQKTKDNPLAPKSGNPLPPRNK